MPGSSQQTQQQSSTTTSSPWSVQSPYLQQAFADAAGAMNQTNGVPTPTELTAGLTPQQLQLFQSAINYGTSNTSPQLEATLGGGAAGAGYSGATGALSELGAFDPSSTNNVNADIAGGNAYAAGQNIPAQVQAAMRDATQQAHDVTLPGLEANAAGTGNVNSSRTGVAEGIVQRGLAQQAGDLSAQLQAQAYNTGAGLTSQENQANNSALLSALNGEGSLGTSLFGGGLGALGQSINDQGSLFNLANEGAAGVQAGNQLQDTNAQQLYQQNTSAPFNGLDQFWNIVGSGNWGGTSSSTGTGQTTTTPSLYQTLGSLLGTGGSLLGGYGGPGGNSSGLLGALGQMQLGRLFMPSGSLSGGLT